MANVKKTKSAPKNPQKTSQRAGLFICLAILVIVVGFFAVRQLDNRNSSEIYFDRNKLNLEFATTQEQKERGLGGRQSIASDQGMLFEFDGEPSVHCFWMKDMNFPIDIIWLDKDQKVVHIEKDVSPDTYPKSFCPSLPTSQVLEVQAGLSKMYGIDVGSQL